MLPTRRIAAAFSGGALLAAVGLLPIGCSSSHHPGSTLVTEPFDDVIGVPAPTSPEGVLRFLQYCYGRRDVASHRMVFTDDFRFVFGAGDSAGNAFRTPWTREDELTYFENLVNGSSSLELVLDPNIQVTDDPAHPGPAHRRIRTSVDLKIVSGGTVEITGFATFTVVRGDSAATTPEIVGQMPLPASSRWYVERWEDDTISGPGHPSWGAIKVAYH